MADKVSQLADKLLQEGVLAGEAEKKSIVEAAQAEAESLKVTAQEEAKALVEAAQKEADELMKNAEKEIKLAGSQAVETLKQSISTMILAKSVDETIASTLADPKVMGAYISTILENWKGEIGASASVELILPESQKSSLEKDLSAALTGSLKGGVSLSFSKSLKGGFQIAPEGESYKITLTNEDFAEFFKEYLRPRVRTILFGA